MITAGILAYNEGKSILHTIKSILPQLAKKDEIVVVASGCTDNTEDVVKKLAKKYKNIKLISEKERSGKALATNLLVRKAKGDIIVQTDADVFLHDDAIKNLVKHFNDKDVGAVSGHPMPILPKNNIFYEWTVMSYRRMHELRLEQDAKGEFWHLSGYLCAFRKKLYSPLPKQKGAVDALMALFIRRSGCKMVYEQNAMVDVKCPITVKDFINQKARVRAGYYFLSKYGDVPRGAKSEILFFPAEILRVPLQRWHAFIFSAFIYAYTWLKGWYFFKKNKPLNEIWKHVTSTK